MLRRFNQRCLALGSQGFSVDRKNRYLFNTCHGMISFYDRRGLIALCTKRCTRSDNYVGNRANACLHRLTSLFLISLASVLCMTSSSAIPLQLHTVICRPFCKQDVALPCSNLQAFLRFAIFFLLAWLFSFVKLGSFFYDFCCNTAVSSTFIVLQALNYFHYFFVGRCFHWCQIWCNVVYFFLRFCYFFTVAFQ